MAHGDYTGQRKTQLAHQFAEEQALAAKSKTLVTQVVQDGQNEVVNLFIDKDEENVERSKKSLQQREDGVVEVDVEPDEQFLPVTFRASEDLEQVTVGQGREFNLKAGRAYEAPKWVAEHLDSQGLVYH